MNPINPNQKMTYSAMVKTIKDLANRINVLTQMQVVKVDSNGTPKFSISSDSAKLDLPDLGALLLEIEELKIQLDECNENSQSLQSQLNELEELITPAEDVNGNGQWQHTTLESTGCRVGSPIVSCAFTDKLSVEYVSGTTFKFRRVNSAGCCGVDGGVTVCAPGSTLLAVFTSPDLTGPLTLGLNGDRGVTSESNKNLSDGTYYVYGRGTGIFKPDCSGFYDEEPYQLLGTFTVSGATLVRTFNVIVTAEG